jgi:hypothetical protein
VAAGGGGVELPEPQALRKNKLQTKSKNNRVLFMTPPKGHTSCLTRTVFVILVTHILFPYFLRREIEEKTGRS